MELAVLGLKLESALKKEFALMMYFFTCNVGILDELWFEIIVISTKECF